MIGDELKKSVEAMVKVLDKARRAATALTKAKDPPLAETLSLIEKTADALRAVRVDDLVEDLDQRRTKLSQLADQALARRREELLRSAEAAGWQVRRTVSYTHLTLPTTPYV